VVGLRRTGLRPINKTKVNDMEIEILQEVFMKNNDILIRLRYALDIKDIDMVEIFKLGGIDVTKEDVLKMLLTSKGSDNNDMDDIDETEENEGNLECSNIMLESFLNGFIIFKRGKKDQKAGESDKPVLAIKNNKSVNNVMLKKLKIALELSSEDMLNILQEAGVIITKGELSAVFRKEGQKNYKECGDRYARNFLKGLAIRYRK
jgi:uncharacterized protein YehS (DUF1456 family)